jgi:hypothetical protein
MAEPREIAEAFLIIVRWLIKWLGIVLAGLMLAGSLGWLGYEGFHYLTNERYAAKVRAVVRTGKECPDSYPLFVGWVNESSRIVRSISFVLTATYENHSTNLASGRRYKEDRIMKPGEGFGRCWNPDLDYSAPKNTKPADLKWGVGSYEVEFDD